jgi:hypothetical protein
MAGFGAEELLDRACKAIADLSAQVERLETRCAALAEAADLDAVEPFTPPDDSLRDVRWHAEATRRYPVFQAEEAKRREEQETAQRQKDYEERLRVQQSQEALRRQLRALPQHDPRRVYLQSMRPR